MERVPFQLCFVFASILFTIASHDVISLNRLNENEVAPVDTERYDTTNATAAYMPPLQQQEFNSHNIHDQNRWLSGRIVGGGPAKGNEFPWFVKPAFDYCGSVLIHDDVLLTAAHCKGKFNGGVRIGITNVDLNNQLDFVRMDKYYVHPKYKSDGSYRHDIMLIKLQRVPKIDPVPIVKYNTNPAIPIPNQSVRVIGFGFTSEKNSTVSNKLRKVDVDIIDIDTCARLYKDNSVHPDERYMMCAGILGFGGKDACYGDSGGPLLLQQSTSTKKSDYVVVGLVSWGRGCARGNQPGVYTKVSRYRKWIRTTLCNITSVPCKK